MKGKEEKNTDRNRRNLRKKIEKTRQKLHLAERRGGTLSDSGVYDVSVQLDGLIMEYYKREKDHPN
ncbi:MULTISPECIES: aspartyl-phosphate phosphatase Spo0E family protein [unclassified Paenibacillus]|uniref:aspartyl-phosphate phosphatase Spo0E family protein n=1 Tax=unclassified Paenibacillus TaxID=185978 RepID=UPI001C115D88|nr:MULTISPECIES: aspartyl-phosphate phosphatase Spo0E family protein [unclassified Paenibacillus]MBU5441349.1 aspartyl-phosphate phosphatase Spo0E family protein [Paenibacillus sp. MSJ-34]CAH0120917.1 hypothetical protein PAE9249_03441 [Paenibacillus sp. CECT 9249]